MEKNLDNIVIIIVSLALLILSFLLLRPILMSVIFGFVLVFIFAPLYDLIHKKVKSASLCATIVTIILIVIITTFLIILVPIIFKESMNLFAFAQEIDFRDSVKNLLPNLNNIDTFAAQVDTVLHTFITDFSTDLLNSVTGFLKDFPVIFLQLTVVFFTFFFVLRDKKDFIEYIKTVLPFPKDVQDRLMKATSEVTASVLYGQLIIGFIQGIVAGIGYFLFGVPNPLLLTVLSIIAGILPIVGPFIVWVPIAIFLLVTGNTVALIGVSIFGIASSVIDNFLRPIMIGKRLMMNSLLAMLGFIGGILLFGVMGLILGPLIIAYLLIFLEVYRNKK